MLPGKLLGWAVITAATVQIAAVFVIIGCAPNLSQQEIDQTIVAAAVTGTRSAMATIRHSEERKRIAPTFHFIATMEADQKTREWPTQVAYSTRSAIAHRANQTRQVYADATRQADNERATQVILRADYALDYRLRIADTMKASGMEQPETIELARACAGYEISGYEIGNLPAELTFRESYIVGIMSVLMNQRGIDRFCAHYYERYAEIEKGRRSLSN